MRIVAGVLDPIQIEELALRIASVRASNGRLFILGLGGSAANASHAASDFRKLCRVECYAPTDNVAELTARINDDGFPNCFVDWLHASYLGPADALLVLSVGGGVPGTSECITRAVRYALEREADIYGIVGRDSGATAQHGHCVIVLPKFSDDLLTPLAETFQAVIWHCLANHPLLRIA